VWETRKCPLPGALLCPDEDASSAVVAVIEDEAGAVAFEIFDREVEVVYVDLSSAQLNAAAPLESNQPERQREANQPLLARIPGHDSQRLDRAR